MNGGPGAHSGPRRSWRLTRRSPSARRLGVGDLEDDGRVVGRTLALALLAVDGGPDDAVGEGGGAQREVDAHALALLEAQLRVVPVGEGAGLARVRAHDVAEAGVDDALEGGALTGRGVGLVLVVRDAPHVGVGRRDVPVAEQGDLRPGVVGQPSATGGRQRVEPAQLVGEVRVVERAAVRDVERPHAYAVAQRADGARLGRDRLAPARHPVEADLHVVETDPRDDGDAVPLAQPVVGDLVAESLEPLERELVGARLGLLDREHVDVAALEPGGDAVDAGSDGVDVPGGDAHSRSP